MSTQEQQRPPSGGMPPRSGGPANPQVRRIRRARPCERRMTVKQVTPVLFASGLDDVIYGCEKCGTEAKRTVKRT